MPELRVRRDGREADQGRGSDAQVPEVRTRSHAGGSHAGGVGRDLTATVVGGGLAGSEAAWALAERGVAVSLYGVRPVSLTAAHQRDVLADILWSNSFT